MQENPGHVFLCLKFGFVFFGVLVEDKHRSKLMYFLDFKFVFLILNLLKLIYYKI